MKKTYINPEMEIVEMKMNNAMLAGSMPKSNDEITDESSVLGRDFGFDDEDF